MSIPPPSQPCLIGVGFDTARYGHHVSFLRSDRQPAAKRVHLRRVARRLCPTPPGPRATPKKQWDVHFCIRIDAAGQYAANLERFLRACPGRKRSPSASPSRIAITARSIFPNARPTPWIAGLRPLRDRRTPGPHARDAAEFAQLRELAGALESQVKQTTRLVNQLHNRLARVFPELALDVPDLSATWVLRLLAKYPSPAKIAGAHLSSLVSIPHLTEDKARKIQAAARQTVASLQGPVVEGLIRQSVQSIRQSQKTSRELKRLLEQAYDALPSGPHRQIETIPGIGKQTAAALVAKMVSIDRFATPEAGRQLLRDLPRREHLGRGQIRPARAPRHHVHESQGERPGSSVLVERGEEPPSCTTRSSAPCTPGNGLWASAATWPWGTACRSCCTWSSPSGRPINRLFRVRRNRCGSGRCAPGSSTSRGGDRGATGDLGPGRRNCRGPQRTRSRKASGHPGTIEYTIGFAARQHPQAGIAGSRATASTSHSCANRSAWNRCCVSCTRGTA